MTGTMSRNIIVRQSLFHPIITRGADLDRGTNDVQTGAHVSSSSSSCVRPRCMVLDGEKHIILAIGTMLLGMTAFVNAFFQLTYLGLFFETFAETAVVMQCMEIGAAAGTLVAVVLFRAEHIPRVVSTLLLSLGHLLTYFLLTLNLVSKLIMVLAGFMTATTILLSLYLFALIIDISSTKLRVLYVDIFSSLHVPTPQLIQLVNHFLPAAKMTQDWYRGLWLICVSLQMLSLLPFTVLWSSCPPAHIVHFGHLDARNVRGVFCDVTCWIFYAAYGLHFFAMSLLIAEPASQHQLSIGLFDVSQLTFLTASLLVAPALSCRGWSIQSLLVLSAFCIAGSVLIEPLSSTAAPLNRALFGTSQGLSMPHMFTFAAAYSPDNFVLLSVGIGVPCVAFGVAAGRLLLRFQASASAMAVLAELVAAAIWSKGNSSKSLPGML